VQVKNDFPEVYQFDASDAPSVHTWWNTLGSKWVRVNIVTDTLGNVVGTSGTSRELTGGADRDLLKALRKESDVVVLGGSTVRAEPDSIPRKSPVAIVSQSGDVPLEALKRARGRITILHGRGATIPAFADGVVLKEFTGAAILSALRKLGYKRIVFEGGPTLASLILQSGLVDELCQTISPQLGIRVPELALVDVAGSLSNVAHDDAGFRYTRRVTNGAPQKSS
jgi:hypothetical protein